MHVAALDYSARGSKFCRKVVRWVEEDCVENAKIEGDLIHESGTKATGKFIQFQGTMNEISSMSFLL